MSKIKNGGLDQYGAERFVDSFCYSQKNAGLKGLKLRYLLGASTLVVKLF